MGIGGSGASACSAIAKFCGYDVEGSDLNLDTPYIKQVLDAHIKVHKGHNVKDLEDVQILVVSPAVKFAKDNKFLEAAKKRNIEIMTWQEFSGKYLHKGKKVICVSGTHGKSTTTAMLGLVFESAGLDPTVLVGAKVMQWGRNFRVGKGNIFITESDEFFDNFLNYSPDMIVLNNIEFDHPDYFKSFDDVKRSFRKHLRKLKGDKTLIINGDDPVVREIVANLDLEKILAYSISDNSSKTLAARIKTDNSFVFDGRKYSLGISGLHNIANSLGVIIASKQFGIDPDLVAEALASFKGIGRRMELIVDGDIKVYDDYAHHPTAIRKTLESLRNKISSKLIVVVEPHSYSRTKALLGDYKGAFEGADLVIVAPIYKARDNDDFGINQESIASTSLHPNIIIAKTTEESSSLAVENAKKGDTIVVMGAGDSHKITRNIKDSL